MARSPRARPAARRRLARANTSILTTKTPSYQGSCSWSLGVLVVKSLIPEAKSVAYIEDRRNKHATPARRAAALHPQRAAARARRRLRRRRPPPRRPNELHQLEYRPPGLAGAALLALDRAGPG